MTEPIDGNLIPDRISALTDDDLTRIIQRCGDDLDRLLLTAGEAASLLGVTKQALSSAVRRGKLVPVLKRLFLRADIKARQGDRQKGSWKIGRNDGQ